ncbi:hypothetical protein ACFOWM_07915 [Ferruginibacter yonginensis]|uniref:Uncharacterized protein n=1 Tax=Ferruginibacter yonginensis TaxID=1310416 RepID=A0ABV8QRA5_9BACT
MNKIKFLATLLFALVVNAVVAQTTSLKWNDSTVTFLGSKIGATVVLGKNNKPALQSTFYYGFDKAAKMHVFHLVKTDISTPDMKYYLIYKYLVPATAVNTSNLKVEKVDNIAVEGGFYAYVSLKCKDDVECFTFYEKGSHYDDFGNESKTDEFTIEASVAEMPALEKLIQQIKNNH